MADLVLPSSLAVWDPLGGTPEPVMTGHDGVCVHTMAGTYVGTDAWFHQDGWSGTESTVGIAGDGRCKQWVPWNRQADANLDGNSRWLSIECADGGESFPPLSTANDESPPLTTAQINKIVDLCVYWCRVETHAACPSTWTCHKVGIPARFIANSCERGIGCHRHGIDPWRNDDCPRWSLFGGKICPRSVRFRQVRDVIVPRVQARLTLGDDFLAELSASEQRNLYNRLARLESWAAGGAGQFLGSADETAASKGVDESMLPILDRAFTQDRGDKDVRTAIADELIEIALARSAEFQKVKDDVAAIRSAL